MTGDAFDHEHAVPLLPWLANGTLDGEERERVERHVRHCLPCRAELAEQTKLRAAVRRQPVVPLSAEAGFERLRARLDRAPSKRRSRGAFPALAAAAAVAAIGVLVAVNLLDSPAASDSGEYRTLSDSVAGRTLIDVIFEIGRAHV